MGRMSDVEKLKDELERWQRREKQITEFMEELRFSSLPIDVSDKIAVSIIAERLQECREEEQQLTHDLQMKLYCA